MTACIAAMPKTNPNCSVVSIQGLTNQVRAKYPQTGFSSISGAPFPLETIYEPYLSTDTYNALIATASHYFSPTPLPTLKDALRNLAWTDCTEKDL